MGGAEGRTRAISRVSSGIWAQPLLRWGPLKFISTAEWGWTIYQEQGPSFPRDEQARDRDVGNMDTSLEGRRRCQAPSGVQLQEGEKC